MDIGSTPPLSPAVPGRGSADPSRTTEPERPAHGVRAKLDTDHYSERAFEVLSQTFGSAPGEADFPRSPKAIADDLAGAGARAMDEAMTSMDLTDEQVARMSEIRDQLTAETSALLESRPSGDDLAAGMASIAEQVADQIAVEIPPPLADELREIFEGLIEELTSSTAQREDPPQVAISAYTHAAVDSGLPPSTVDTAA